MASNFFISEACLALKPNNGVKVSGEGDTFNIVWADPSDVPTDSAINTKATELENAEPLRLLRIERTKLLAATDWVIAMHTELGTSVPTAWKTYRKALRDITDGATDEDAHDLWGYDVTWPTKPS